MSRPALEGVIAAIPTPFRTNEDLALDALTANLEHWNRTPLHGYTVLGTTGEAVSLSADERKQVLSTAREAIPSDRVLVAGTGAESTRETIALTRFAGEIGCDYAIVVTPHYNRPSFAAGALADHYHRVADASSIPIVLYHIPQCTGIDFPAETVAKIAQHPNVAGIKDSSGDLEGLRALKRACPDDFRVLTGAATDLLEAMRIGCAGAILADASVAPELAAAVYEAASSGDGARARALQERLGAFSRVLIGGYGAPGVKALLDRIGYYGGVSRRPLVTPDDASEELLAALETARQEIVSS